MKNKYNKIYKQVEKGRVFIQCTKENFVLKNLSIFVNEANRNPMKKITVLVLFALV